MGELPAPICAVLRWPEQFRNTAAIAYIDNMASFAISLTVLLAPWTLAPLFSHCTFGWHGLTLPVGGSGLKVSPTVPTAEAEWACVAH